MGEPPRPITSRLPLVVALLIAAGFVTLPQVDRQAIAEPAACDPAAVMNHRLDELGRSGYVWTIEPIEGTGTGVTLIDDHAVKVSPKTTCALMTTVVNHEWMHVQQGHKYGTNERVYAAYGFEVEMVADCGSMLLGSTWLPYVDRHRQETGDGCSEYELAAARSLIDQAHHH